MLYEIPGEGLRLAYILTKMKRDFSDDLNNKNSNKFYRFSSIPVFDLFSLKML